MTHRGRGAPRHPRSWVRQADIDDGVEPGTTTAEQRGIRESEQEVRELRRANDLLKRASSCLAGELDHPVLLLPAGTALA